MLPIKILHANFLRNILLCMSTNTNTSSLKIQTALDSDTKSVYQWFIALALKKQIKRSGEKLHLNWWIVLQCSLWAMFLMMFILCVHVGFNIRLLKALSKMLNIPLASCAPPPSFSSPLWFVQGVVSSFQAQLSAHFCPTWCHSCVYKTTYINLPLCSIKNILENNAF